MMPATKIDVANARIAPDFANRSFGEDRAFDQDGDALRETEDEAHIVLDDKDAEPLGHAQQQIEQRAALGRGKPRRRLVEQQSLGLERQHEGDLDEPTLSVGQIDDAPRRELEQAELLQQSRRAIDDLGMIGGIAPDAPVEPVPRLESEADILGDSEMRK